MHDHTICVGTKHLNERSVVWFSLCYFLFLKRWDKIGTFPRLNRSKVGGSFGQPVVDHLAPPPPPPSCASCLAPCPSIGSGHPPILHAGRHPWPRYFELTDFFGDKRHGDAIPRNLAAFKKMRRQDKWAPFVFLGMITYIYGGVWHMPS